MTVVPPESHSILAVDMDQDVLGPLLLRIADGDVDAFERLFRRTGARIFALVLRVLADHDLSQDTTQEVSLQVWLTAERFDPSLGSALGWLTTLARRRAIDRVRREQAYRDRQQRYGAGSHVTAHDHVAEAMTATLESEAVTRSLLALSPLQAEAIQLAFFGGLTYLEVAATLGVPLPTVKSRIRDGLKSLRRSLEQDGLFLRPA
ncbi:sigma-70 family RNA polymerase sigma factor [Paenarthrobacter sp. Z7-10]|uniref:sigma-70 family RNA polymerase sigma factor n=1 Tax=Paenarthrobacter sp. Z7-10 TaxID=2787635 RepID=UPI0022A96D74|nr:sigma-70 family RNA polymerase sigma factor [Paenarthrobacter sp. Z7-10]MCZ2404652.1 sigma-70 family RNA polymerase sigma factor [Paenarthrobacter sp. Z7-10]